MLLKFASAWASWLISAETAAFLAVLIAPLIAGSKSATRIADDDDHHQELDQREAASRLSGRASNAGVGRIMVVSPGRSSGQCRCCGPWLSVVVSIGQWSVPDRLSAWSGMIFLWSSRLSDFAVEIATLVTRSMLILPPRSALNRLPVASRLHDPRAAGDCPLTTAH